MIELLSKLFIKDYKHPEKPAVREKYGSLASIVGIITNTILSLIKLFIGLITASLAITADALNNLSDAGASVVSLVSFKMSAKPADRDHPFGHARIEYVASMIVSFLILLVGFETIVDSVRNLMGLSEEKSPEFTAISLIIIGCSILGKLWLSIFYYKIGKKIDSSVIKASSTDSLMDCISTTAVLVSSIIIKLTGIEMIDAIMGIAVSGLILFAGIKILIETKNSILGSAPVAETVEQIKEIVSNEPLVIGMHDLIVHNYGPRKYIASFHAEVDGKEDIFLLHDAIDNLERNIINELGILCTIHLDPLVTDNETINELRALVNNAVKSAYPSVGVHDFRAVIGHTHTNLIFDIEVPFEEKDSEEKIKSNIENIIKEINKDYFCVITVDRI